MPALIGRKLVRAMAMDDYFFPSDLSDGAVTARRYRFDRPWGVPVRYHDAEKFLEVCQPDIIEFHLSYNDMERDPATYLSGTYDLGFVVQNARRSSPISAASLWMNHWRPIRRPNAIAFSPRASANSISMASN
jgi:hypothetical protein